MLRRTFMHVPGIGPATERRLWTEGILYWEEYFASRGYRSLSPALDPDLIQRLRRWAE